MDSIRIEGIMTEYKRGLAMNVDLKERTDLHIISFSRHYTLYCLLKKVVEIFDKNNIKYFIIGGLLIGLHRHNNSFIPWDDDIDILY